MIDDACNYLNPYASATLSAAAAASMPSIGSSYHNPQQQHQQPQPGAATTSTAVAAIATSGTPPLTHISALAGPQSNNVSSNTRFGDFASNASNFASLYGQITSTAATTPAACGAFPMKMEMQNPPQLSSTGTPSPISSNHSGPSSASVSPTSIFPSPAQSFASISSSPPASATSSSVSPLSGSPTAAHTAAIAAHTSAAAAASAAYSWNTYSTAAALPTRTHIPAYAQYATDYYGNVGMSATAASAATANAWFTHPDRLYQPWPSQAYANFNFDELAYHTQLHRRSVRCSCPNCRNEMAGLAPIVGPDERGRKQHLCDIRGCGRVYGKASHLKTHMRWHTGERPFLCLTCGKRFSRSDELQRHGRTHTNYRPYSCQICSKKFSRSDHLSKHNKTHFKDKKSKKALAAEAKQQASTSKQEEVKEVNKENTTSSSAGSLNSTTPSVVRQSNVTSTTNATSTTSTTTTNNKNATITSRSNTHSTTAASRLAASTSTATQLQLKTEQTDPPNGYNPYTNLYHQSSSLFQHAQPLVGSGVYPNGLQQHVVAQQRQQQQQQAAASASSLSLASPLFGSAPFDLWSSNAGHHQQQQQQQQQEQQLSRSAILQQEQSVQGSTASNNINTTSTATTSNLQQQQQQQQTQKQQHQQRQQQQQLQSSLSASAVNSRHYAALAMQSESQLAAEYGLTISSPGNSNDAISPVTHHSHPTTTAPNAATYPGLLQMKSEYISYPDFSVNSGYGNGGALYHHAPNPWATTAGY
ncbi:transcription factor btd [Anastrepha ludens]|uniref:transcription factor btd n=1 Tax=Anastrepha ludens TaxID=28586 RepID=UPI0023B03CF5|nr:transcription factor btd [Anastrepha ludens]